MVILGIDPGYAIVGWGVIGYENNHFKVFGLRRDYHARRHVLQPAAGADLR